MAQLVHFVRKQPTGSSRNDEFIVIDSGDLGHTALEEEYGEEGWKIDSTTDIDGTGGVMPTDRRLIPDW
ncbi:MAG: hypothetical protein V3U27_21400 [Candidatus Tectomicrobia bacterium]